MSADTTANDTQAPTTAAVARRLDVDPRRLVRFVDFHPDPSAANVLGWAYADPQHEAAVAAWLKQRARRRQEESPDFDGATAPKDVRSVRGDS
jgi:hypothetical protein